MGELTLLRTVLAFLGNEVRRFREDDKGMTTETVIITAVLAALAIAVTAIIVAKMTSKAESIPTG